MNNAGIICDLEYSRHPLFKSYYYAIVNAIKQTPKLVNGAEDLSGLKTLFIPDDHYGVHKNIWQQEKFIDYVNAKDIRVIAFTGEKTLNSFFPWNADNLKQLNKFKNLHHYMSDVDDCIALGRNLNRISISKNVFPAINQKDKINKIVFIGNTKCKSYNERKEVINDLTKIMKVDVISPTFEKWENYMRCISQYRFVFSPIGNANFFTMRFYEVLSVGSIPIHQIRNNTLSYYDIEGAFDDCIFFENVNELPEKINKCTLQKSHNMLWMEDNIEMLLRKDGLI